LWSEVVRMLVQRQAQYDGTVGDGTLRAWALSFGEHWAETCAFCGDVATTVDHLRPVLNKGLPTGNTHSSWNLAPACARCNSGKRNLSWREWMARNPPDEETAMAWIERYDRLRQFDSADVGDDKRTVPAENLEMYNAIRENVYAYCKTLHAVVERCRDDPEHWVDHVGDLPNVRR
jgi:hypothetical protein